MEARAFRTLFALAALACFGGASYRTPNFVVQTADPQLAEQIAKTAEQFRRDLATAWLGQPMPDWSQPCMMVVQVGPNLGAGGATTFLFDRGEVYGWRMNIQGSAQRVLDSVLPHEITHMVFASHFRCPVPRWADEGGATSVEHPSERTKHHRMLVQFLQTGRGIAFNQMYAMTEYPADVMPLYAQGFALAEFLIMQGGRQKYLEYVGEGIRTQHWSAATKRHYGYGDLGVLQNAWLAWVSRGFPNLQPKNQEPEKTPETQFVSNTPRPRPMPNLIYHINSKTPEDMAPAPGQVANAEAEPPESPQPMVPVVRPGQSAAGQLAASGPRPLAKGWRTPNLGTDPQGRLADVLAPGEPVRAEVTHPQPIQRPGQMILEWSRPN